MASQRRVKLPFPQYLTRFHDALGYLPETARELCSFSHGQDKVVPLTLEEATHILENMATMLEDANNTGMGRFCLNWYSCTEKTSHLLTVEIEERDRQVLEDLRNKNLVSEYHIQVLENQVAQNDRIVFDVCAFKRMKKGHQATTGFSESCSVASNG